MDKVVEAMARGMAAKVAYQACDSDLVCKQCRGRAGHLEGCSLAGEPWPTITLYRDPTPEEATRAAIAAARDAGYVLAPVVATERLLDNIAETLFHFDAGPSSWTGGRPEGVEHRHGDTAATWEERRKYLGRATELWAAMIAAAEATPPPRPPA